MEDSVNFFWGNWGSEKLGLGPASVPEAYPFLAFYDFGTIGPLMYDIKTLGFVCFKPGIHSVINAGIKGMGWAGYGDTQI